MSIFDNMREETFENDSKQKAAPNKAEGYFTVQFGTESAGVQMRNGMTVKDAFMMNADFLGFDPDRQLAYRDNNNNLLDGHEAPEVGATYAASITHDEKG